MKVNQLLWSGTLFGAFVCISQPASALSLDLHKASLVSFPAPAATIFVAEPSVATYQLVTPRKVLIMGRGLGLTTFMALDEQGNAIYKTDIVVGYDLTRMKSTIRSVYPSLNIKLSPTADGVIVSGDVPSPAVAADIITIVDSFVKNAGGSSVGGKAGSSSSSSDTTGPGTGTGTLGSRTGNVINRLNVLMPNQVIIRVRFAEVSRNVSEKLGINWFWARAHKGGSHPFAIGLATNAVTSSTPTLFGHTFSVVPDFSAMIDALAAQSLVSILAEPNLSVVSGETASFLAGGQIAIPQSNGLGTTSVTWKDYGVKLDVAPTVLSENRMSLRIRPEVSQLSAANGTTTDGYSVPGLITRKAETTIELADGQSFVIGGLLQNNLSNDVNKIPLIGDLPVMGTLFRSKEFSRNETELVMIATAYIAKPSKAQLRIPNAAVVIPNMFERLFLGKDPQVKPGILKPADMVF